MRNLEIERQRPTPSRRRFESHLGTGISIKVSRQLRGSGRNTCRRLHVFSLLHLRLSKDCSYMAQDRNTSRDQTCRPMQVRAARYESQSSDPLLGPLFLSLRNREKLGRPNGCICRDDEACVSLDADQLWPRSLSWPSSASYADVLSEPPAARLTASRGSAVETWVSDSQ